MPFVIENPILNSPYLMPSRHFEFTKDGYPTGTTEGRRRSSYWVPVPPSRKTSNNLSIDDLLPDERHDNDAINRIRQLVDSWRDRGYPLITPATRELLEYWRSPDRERRLFFCQIEALETLIYISEAARKDGAESIIDRLNESATAAGTPLFRIACKMATGTGKTVVMAMLIAWQVVNRCRYPNRREFSDAFLIVAPNITIRDRLQVLHPSDPDNYYRKLDIVPAEMKELGSAKIVITNFHQFKLKEKGDAGKLTKTVLAYGKKTSAFTESPDEMARRICRDLGNQREIVVINDEAHHCYRRNPNATESERLKGEERKEAAQRDEEARLWINGLEAVKRKIGVKAVYDLSATPFYLKGSGYREGELFPWVVSDFSLIDAIESGIVKTPRVPTQDNSLGNEDPMFRNLWMHIREGLKSLGPKREAGAGPPIPPKELQAALHALYQKYEKEYQDWDQRPTGRAEGNPPPVLIVVCNSTAVSKLVFDYIAGFESGRRHPDGSPVVTPGQLPLFSNVEDHRWKAQPMTILVDSAQLESEDGISAEFKALAAPMIEEFRHEYRQRKNGNDDIDDTVLMREVLNTVGKKGRLGEKIRCVVSVSMLTEGWDANTVTHILGVRAFGTQLLCEQVIGRGLRRMSHTLNEQGHFDPEYADVFGVPFRFLPVVGSGGKKGASKTDPGFVRAEPSRLIECPYLEIEYPRVCGYQHEPPPDRLEAVFTRESTKVLSVADLPTKTTSEAIAGKSEQFTLDSIKAKRMAEVEFQIAKAVADHYAPRGDGHGTVLFPQLLAIVRRWIAECVEIKDHVFPQLLFLAQNRQDAAEKIFRAIRSKSGGPPKVKAVLQSDIPYGSTSYVSFDTLKRRFKTRYDKCHVNFVPYDSEWEAHFAQTLEDSDALPEVLAYVKNQNLGFRIPYSHEGRPGNYYPDYIVKIDDGRGSDDPLNLVVEISGEDLEQKQAKVGTAANLWVPAVNALGTCGRWAYLELRDPLKAVSELKAFLAAQARPD